jgi:hypothetical protein
MSRQEVNVVGGPIRVHTATYRGSSGEGSHVGELVQALATIALVLGVMVVVLVLPDLLDGWLTARYRRRQVDIVCGKPTSGKGYELVVEVSRTGNEPVDTHVG